MSRKPIDLKKLCPEQRKKIEKSGISPEDLAVAGVNCNFFIEPVPKFDDAPCEVVKKNAHNAWIILGRDRFGAKEDANSGYGPLGHTGAGSVDIVVGRMAGTKGGPNCNRVVAPNFATDAARVYISQKTDIDRSLGLVGDSQLVGRSGVAIKADGVRIVGREGVKIVTHKAKNFEGLGRKGEKNSQGDDIEDGNVAGIELIAGNDLSEDKLEPIVKAYALADTLESIVQMITDLAKVVNENAKIQTQLNIAMAAHTHQVAGVQAFQSGDLCINVGTKEAEKMSSVHSNLYKHRLKLNFASMNSLKQTGAKWFGSRYNKTN